jgi:hypothetical protein|tara:strand:+ start:881 stop:1849 length:969 start_codon:yes stop_codon:yes gene_type:complete
MYRSLFISSGFHVGIIILSILAFPFIAKKPIDVLPVISVELIEIGKLTNIPFAPKAKKIIEKIKKKNEKLASEQAPPKKIKKEKNKKVNLDENKEIKELASKKTPTPENKIKKIKKEKLESVALPDKKKKNIKLKEEKKQKPSKEIKKDKNLKKNIKKIKPSVEETKVKQVSEFEKKELFDLNNIAALIDKSKEDFGETNKKLNKISQSQDSSMDSSKLTLSEEDALKAQIFGCWSIPLGLPYNEDLLVRIKLKLRPDGTLIKTEILDHARMNMPGQGFFRVLAESALRAIQLCQPLKVPTSGYERWKDLQLNFDAREMLGG